MELKFVCLFVCLSGFFSTPKFFFEILVKKLFWSDARTCICDARTHVNMKFYCTHVNMKQIHILGQSIGVDKSFWSKKIFGRKKNFGWKLLLVENKFWLKNFFGRTHARVSVTHARASVTHACEYEILLHAREYETNTYFTTKCIYWSWKKFLVKKIFWSENFFLVENNFWSKTNFG